MKRPRSADEEADGGDGAGGHAVEYVLGINVLEHLGQSEPEVHSSCSGEPEDAAGRLGAGVGVLMRGGCGLWVVAPPGRQEAMFWQTFRDVLSSLWSQMLP